MKPSFLTYTVVLCGLLSVGNAQSPAEQPTRFGFVLNKDLFFLLGQWDVKNGWRDSDAIRSLPEPRSVFTIFGVEGRLGLAYNGEAYRPTNRHSPWDFQARLTGWRPTLERFYALAIEGDVPDLQIKAQTTSGPEVMKLTKEALSACGVKVDNPLVTFARQADIDADGIPDFLITAHSDQKALRDNQAEVIYAIAFIAEGKSGKIHRLSQNCGKKPSTQTLEDYWRYAGAFPFYRFVALSDIDRNHLLEVTTYGSAGGDTEVTLYPFPFKKGAPFLRAWQGY